MGDKVKKVIDHFFEKLYFTNSYKNIRVPLFSTYQYVIQLNRHSLEQLIVPLKQSSAKDVLAYLGYFLI